VPASVKTATVESAAGKSASHESTRVKSSDVSQRPNSRSFFLDTRRVNDDTGPENPFCGACPDYAAFGDVHNDAYDASPAFHESDNEDDDYDDLPELLDVPTVNMKVIMIVMTQVLMEMTFLAAASLHQMKP